MADRTSLITQRSSSRVSRAPLRDLLLHPLRIRAFDLLEERQRRAGTLDRCRALSERVQCERQVKQRVALAAPVADLVRDGEALLVELDRSPVHPFTSSRPDRVERPAERGDLFAGRHGDRGSQHAVGVPRDQPRPVLVELDLAARHEAVHHW
jgi:hypothetical protein